MILINKNSNNTVVLTLKEKSITGGYFLFNLVNDITKNAVNFIAPDISLYQDRYNEFVITETTGTNILTSGTITLSPTGTWTYRVYEQSSNTNLNPLLADNQTPLEEGIVKVVGTSISYTGYSGQDNTFITYGTGS